MSGYVVKVEEEGDCPWCGCPIYVGDMAWEHADRAGFCCKNHAMRHAERRVNRLPAGESEPRGVWCE